MKTGFILRNLLEQSATEWQCSLNQQNVEDFESVQKYTNYKHALQVLEMETFCDNKTKKYLKTEMCCPTL